MPAFSSRYMDDERDRLRGVARGTIDRSGTLDAAGMTPSGAFQSHPGFGDVPQPALSNAAPPGPPTSQATEGYPPASPMQASSQGGVGAAPFNPSRKSALSGGTYKPGDPAKKKPQNTTKDLFRNADPLAIEDALEASVEAMDKTAKGNPDAFKQVEAALTLKGIDTRKAFEDLRDNLMDDAAKRRNARASKVYNEKEFKKRWKNIFNIIPEERMGMFLFDFGLRMLAASGTPGGAGSHAGIAGMGALQSMHGRMDVENQQAMEDQRFASEEARSIMGMEQDAQAGALRAGELALSQERLRQEIGKGNRIDPENIVWTTKGAMYDDGSGLKPLRDAEGGALQPHERFGKGGSGYERPYESDIRYNRLRAAGVDHTQATFILEGAPTEAEARMRASESFDTLADKQNTKYTLPDGSRKYLRDFSEKERRAWIEQRVREVTGSQAGAGTSAPAMPQRPEGWDNY